MGGGTTGLDESFLYIVDVEYGWGDACDKKVMHGCPWIKKAPVMETFSCPTCSATLLFLSYEFPLLAASSGKSRYLSSHAVPRRLPAIVTFLASKARYASLLRDSGKELRKTCFRLTSSTSFK
ncbi:hypothetical protein Tco_0853482 [Tanacetum coccineum]